jgi:hypothetical protein
MSYESVVLADSPTFYWKMENAAGNDTDQIASKTLTAGGGVTVNQAGNGSTWTGLASDKCWSFSGATAGAQTSALDLSATQIITVEYLGNWTTFANDDALALEFSANYNSNTGGFIVNPDDSGHAKFEVASNGAGITSATFTRGSNATWHHYLFVMDTTTQNIKTYVDGADQTPTVVQGGSATNFGNYVLNVMCRNSTSLLGAGKMSQLAIYSSDKSARAAAHFAALTASAAPVADFTGTPLTITSGQTVTFTDASTNTPTSWLYEKNDGSGWVNFSGTPTAQNPTETFT